MRVGLINIAQELVSSGSVQAPQRFSPKSTGICPELLIFSLHVLRHYLLGPGDAGLGNNNKHGEQRRSNVMIIRLVEKERYSNKPSASVHQHDCRILETKDKRVRIKLTGR